uniref:Uncharacterized protein n=1 Tax=Sipha flava TaxID=143950 RepID=A0A2S2QZY1_9HEMI
MRPRIFEKTVDPDNGYPYPYNTDRPIREIRGRERSLLQRRSFSGHRNEKLYANTAVGRHVDKPMAETRGVPDVHVLTIRLHRVDSAIGSIVPAARPKPCT